MNATVLDLRYKMNKVLGALDNRECVHVLFHGKLKGTIIPVGGSSIKTTDHAFYGSDTTSGETVEDAMKGLRGGRYRDI
jgi:hypothetical protein